MNAVGTVRRAGRDLMQENHGTLPFLYPHGAERQPIEFAREQREFMVVRREQRPAATGLVQLLHHRPGNGEAVEGCRAAPDLVEDHQRAFACLVQDRRRLDHLDHEGRTSPRKVVGGADAAEQPVHRPDMRAVRRHEAAHLGQDGDERVLAQEGALAGHVRPGHQPEPALRREVAAIRDEGLVQRCLDDGMAPAFDLEGKAVVHQRPVPAAFDGKRGETGGRVEQG